MPTEHGPVMREVIVLAGGDPVVRPLPRPLPVPDLVIAADSGLSVSQVIGLTVDLVVGDLDSVDQQLLADARLDGVRIERYPVDKDQTDLAIALDAVAAAGPARVTLVGGHGGRLDHLLGNLVLLAAPAYRSLEIRALLGPAVVTIARGRREITGLPGELVSLIAMHGPAHGVSTDGLRFALSDASLPAGSSLGVSNTMTAERATVDVREGVVAVVQPGDIPRTQ